MTIKRLCLVIPSLQAGGMERVMSELAGYFCMRNNLKVSLVLYGREPDLFYKVPDNILVYRPALAFNNKYRRISAFYRLIFLRHSISQINPDAVLSFGEYWNSFVLLALYGLHCPVYISDRCSPEKEFSVLHRILRRILYPRAKGIIAQTEKARTLFLKQFGNNNNIRVIGNPIRILDDQSFLKAKENIVLTVGRIIKSKHHDKLIEVFSEIQAPGWKLVIVGDDALNQSNKAKLKELINRLGMEGKIILAGTQSNVDEYYLKSKIFAFTSSSEGFPNVIGEAMSAALPVISFACVAGPDEIIQDEKSGLLVPVFNFNLFRTKLKLLIENEILRINLGQQAREQIQNYSLDKIGKEYYDFIFS